MAAGATDRPTVRRVGWVGLATLALIAAGCFPGSSAGNSEKLEALRNDPMARYVPPGGRLVDSNEVEEHTSFGKPITAKIRRVFSLPDGDLENELQRTLKAAAATGWTVSDGPVVRLDIAFGQVARKQLPSGWAQMTVTAYPHGTRGSAVHRTELAIRLDHS